MSICKPETVADAVEVIIKINSAIEEYYRAMANDTTSKIYIDEESLRTLKQGAELYVESLKEMSVNQSKKG